MCHDSVQIFRVNGVEDVKEVFPTWAFIICIVVLEIDVEGSILLEVLPEVLYRQLVPVRHVDEVDLLFLQQLLVVGKDCS